MPPKIEPLESRFARLTQRVGECLEWIGSLDAYGYGQVNVGRTAKRKAHRLAWEMAFGPIPTGLCVCHRCDNPACVRPEHLFLGSQSDNRADCVAKGRSRGGRTQVFGEKNPHSKLTDQQRTEIRALAATHTQKELGRMYGVRQSTISRIIGRRIVEAHCRPV